MNHTRKLTRYAFISHLEAYIKKLLDNPSTAKVDDFLRDKGINEEKALEMLTTPIVEENPDSQILIKKEKIKRGPDGKDRFVISYRLLGKNFKNKMRNLYIKCFEKDNEQELDTMKKKELQMDECTTAAGVGGQYVAPLTGKPIKGRMAKTVFLTSEQVEQLKETLIKEHGNQ